MSKATIPAIVEPILKIAEEACIESPMWDEKKVQKTMPRDSPHETLQKQLRNPTRNIQAVRLRLIGNATRTPKQSEERVLNGISRMV